MAIITISRGSYSKGKEVAEKVAERLHYDCISRDVILDTSDHFNIPEVKLIRAIHDAPTLLDRFGHDKRSYIAYFQSALTERVKRDNVVYHGLAGHLLLKGVPHVLKVRIISDFSERVKAEMEREGCHESDARKLILKDDQERRKWTRSLFGADPWDSSLYDLVVHIHKLTVEDAVDFISQAACRDAFKTTDASMKQMEDLALACRIKAELVDEFFDIYVSSDYGNVVVYAKDKDRSTQKLRNRVKTLGEKIRGIHHIEVHGGIPVPANAV
ncbi:MAG: cytidylate kinase-like family protein [Deltaproteobacteria bacterium]|nr:cytidylate kinase-like family protein [Deltaproteobacteria bacterium]